MNRVYVLNNAGNRSYLKQNIVVGILCFIAGFILSFLPLIGWSNYTLEPSNTSCMVEWKVKKRDVITYNIFLLVIVYIVPLSLIIVSNIILIKKVCVFYFTFNFHLIFFISRQLPNIENRLHFFI